MWHLKQFGGEKERSLDYATRRARMQREGENRVAPPGMTETARDKSGPPRNPIRGANNASHKFIRDANSAPQPFAAQGKKAAST